MGEGRPAPRSEAEARTQARSGLGRLLGRAFTFPEGASHQEPAGGAWERGVEETPDALPFLLSLADLNLTATELPAEHLRAQYGRLFEVGFLGGPPCPLFAGHDERDRQRLMEESIRIGREGCGHIAAAPAVP